MQALLINDEKGLALEDFEMMGNLSFAQLNEIRHRGAFSTVAATFLTCCVKCQASELEGFSGLPAIWYQVCKLSGHVDQADGTGHIAVYIR